MFWASGLGEGLGFGLQGLGFGLGFRVEAVGYGFRVVYFLVISFRLRCSSTLENALNPGP